MSRRKPYLSALIAATVLVAGAAAALLAMSPEAEAAFPGKNGQIAFASFRDDATEDRIYVMGPDGSGVRPLPGQGFDGSPQWSPDGMKIAFTTNETDLEPRGEIYVINADGSGAANLTNSPDSHERGAVAWYPSGRRIAFCAAPTGRNEDGDLMIMGDYEIFTAPLDRSKSAMGPPVQLTDNDARDCPSSVSPDGTKLAFTSDRDGDDEIYVVGAKGPDGPANPAVKLTRNGVQDQDADWSPDGKRLAFARRDPTTSTTDVYTMDARGRGVENLTGSAENYDSYPSWSPNGKKIAFTSYRPTEGSGGFGGGIWKMRTDGSREIQLTSEYGDGSPDWQPLP